MTNTSSNNGSSQSPIFPIELISDVWRQPIPTSVYQVFGEDYTALNLYIHLLLRARSTDMKQYEYYNGKCYKLLKGESLFGKKAAAKILRISESGAGKVLDRLRDRFGVVDTKPSHDFTIVKLINYDLIISMCTPNGQQGDSERTPSNTNKNAKTEKTEETDTVGCEIVKWLSTQENINNPEAYYKRAIVNKFDTRVIERVWKRKQFDSPSKFIEHCQYYQEKHDKGNASR